MKVVLFVLLAIAVTANANMLRNHAPLLAVCRGESPAAKCCEYKQGEDHDLYLKPKKGSSCCNKNIGMWVPTTKKDLDNAYCGHAERDEMNFLKRNLKEMCATATQFKRALDGLKDEQKDFENEFRNNYVKHEKHENKAQKVNDDKRKMLEDKKTELTQVQKAAKDSRVTMVKTVANIIKMKASFIKEWITVVMKSKAARSKLKQALGDTAKMEKRLDDETSAFAACKFEDKKKKLEVEELQKVIKDETSAVKAAAESLNKAEANLDSTKTATETEAKNMETEIAEANKKLDGLKTQEGDLTKRMDKLAGALKRAEDRLVKSAENLVQSKKDLEASKSFLEVGSGKKFIKGVLKKLKEWWNKDCDESCQSLRSFSAKNYIANRRSDESVKSQPATLTKIFHEKLAEMQQFLNYMEDKAKRYTDLHDHDVNLHREIMADIEKEFKEIKEQFTKVNGLITTYENKRVVVQAIIAKLNAHLQAMLQAQNDKISSEKKLIEKNQADTNNLISRMELLATRVAVVAKQNQECKAGVEKLKKAAGQAKKDAEALTKKKKDMVKDLEDVEKETQIVKDKAAAHKAKLESELEQVEEEDKETAMRVKNLQEDIDDGKARGKAMAAATKTNQKLADKNNEEAAENDFGF